jgi:PPK2 family polyphosphate:nucleotide phosphotransferase
VAAAKEKLGEPMATLYAVLQQSIMTNITTCNGKHMTSTHKKIREAVRRFSIGPSEQVRLGKRKTDEKAGLTKSDAKDQTRKNVARICELQELLYAENARSLLVILQGMDAAGKDGTVRHVFGPVNPQGCRVTSFKAPTSEELSHDFLWRIHRAVPPTGHIGVFNRSHYEDVLAVRVLKLAPPKVWRKRYELISDFEKLLTAEGVVILKFFLHISKSEQLERLKARLDDPTKHWKANPGDFEQRKMWRQYQKAYADVLSQCSTREAPWYIIPADRKWFRNLAISEIVRHKLESLSMDYPAAEFDVSAVRAE